MSTYRILLTNEKGQRLTVFHECQPPFTSADAVEVEHRVNNDPVHKNHGPWEYRFSVREAK